MKRIFTQSELKQLLETNPLKIPVFFDEVISSADSYIIVYRIMDNALDMTDNQASMYSNDIQISCFVKDSVSKNKIAKFLKKHFLSRVRFIYEDEWYQIISEPELIVKDW